MLILLLLFLEVYKINALLGGRGSLKSLHLLKGFRRYLVLTVHIKFCRSDLNVVRICPVCNPNFTETVEGV